MSDKPVCTYDGKCYRKNPQHFEEFGKISSLLTILDHPKQYPEKSSKKSTDGEDDRIYDFYNKNRTGILKANPDISSNEVSEFVLESYKKFTDDEKSKFQRGVTKLSTKLKKDLELLKGDDEETFEIFCKCSKEVIICDACVVKMEDYFRGSLEEIIQNQTKIKLKTKEKDHQNKHGLQLEELDVSIAYETLLKKFTFFKKFVLGKFSNEKLFQMGLDSNTITNSSYFFISGCLNKFPLISVKDTVVKYPLTEKNYLNLKEHSKKSPFGLKDKTIFDENVRRSFEIDSLDISLPTDFQLTNSKDYEILEVIRKELAPNSKQISCELYKMVLYEKESHFKVHKDTLRKKNHFGTLVLFLPAQYEGGEFVLSHNNITKVFDFSMKDELNFNWLAFYTDCDHEIKELKKGNRITLTYNLYHDDNEDSFIPNQIVKCDISSIHDSICDLLKAKQSCCFLLSHYYSQSSLKPQYLKGRDLEFYNSLSESF
jgi:hypothetical protein